MRPNHRLTDTRAAYTPVTEEPAPAPIGSHANAAAVAQGWVIAPDSLIGDHTLREWCGLRHLTTRRARGAKPAYRLTIPGVGAWQTTAHVAQIVGVWSREARGLPAEPDPRPYQLHMWRATQAPMW